MNIETVIANLKNTIEGKKQLLKTFEAYSSTSLVAETMRSVVQINLEELEAILKDLESCPK